VANRWETVLLLAGESEAEALIGQTFSLLPQEFIANSSGPAGLLLYPMS